MSVETPEGVPPGDDVADEVTPDEVTPEEPSPVLWRIITVSSVTLELPEQYPLVTLDDAEVAGRRLAFRVGMPEGIALRHAIDGTNGPRPSTQDLLVATIRALGAQVAAVRLTGRIGANYLAEMEVVATNGRHVLACRPSDGVALALRRGIDAPVLADDRLFEPGDVA